MSEKETPYTPPQPVTGSCLCGGVAFSVRHFTRQIIACHCAQCRKTSGHYVAATRALLSDMGFTSDETLQWYRSSDIAARGFCQRCGGNLFYKAHDADAVSIMAGVLDNTHDLILERHIFTDDALGYVNFDYSAAVSPKSD